MRKTLLLTFICGLLIAFGTSFTFKQSEKKFLQKKGFEFVQKFNDDNIAREINDLYISVLKE